jgi:peptide deformylase
MICVQIMEKSKATEVDEEGCLSFPKIYADVEVGERRQQMGLDRLSRCLILKSDCLTSALLAQARHSSTQDARSMTSMT